MLGEGVASLFPHGSAVFPTLFIKEALLSPLEGKGESQADAMRTVEPYWSDAVGISIEIVLNL